MASDVTDRLAERASPTPPPSITARVRGLSDRAIAWLFIGPSIVLLLAINIFPLFWTIYLSFTNFRANQPGREVKWLGARNYERLLGSEDISEYLQATAHFVVWMMVLQVAIGLGLALLINRNFRGAGFWTYIYQPQTGIFSYIIDFFAGTGPLDMIGSVSLAPWSIILFVTVFGLGNIYVKVLNRVKS